MFEAACALSKESPEASLKRIDVNAGRNAEAATAQQTRKERTTVGAASWFTRGKVDGQPKDVWSWNIANTKPTPSIIETFAATMITLIIVWQAELQVAEDESRSVPKHYTLELQDLTEVAMSDKNPLGTMTDALLKKSPEQYTCQVVLVGVRNRYSFFLDCVQASVAVGYRHKPNATWSDK